MLHYLFTLTNNKTHRKLYMYSLYLSYILYAIVLTGVFYISPTYLVDLQSVLVYYVCGFIILRFNPFVTRELCNEDDFERRVIFSSATFLLFTTSITQFMMSLINKVVHMEPITG